MQKLLLISLLLSVGLGCRSRQDSLAKDVITQDQYGKPAALFKKIEIPGISEPLILYCPAYVWDSCDQQIQALIMPTSVMFAHLDRVARNKSQSQTKDVAEAQKELDKVIGEISQLTRANAELEKAIPTVDGNIAKKYEDTLKSNQFDLKTLERKKSQIEILLKPVTRFNELVALLKDALNRSFSIELDKSNETEREFATIITHAFKNGGNGGMPYEFVLTLLKPENAAIRQSLRNGNGTDMYYYIQTLKWAHNEEKEKDIRNSTFNAYVTVNGSAVHTGPKFKVPENTVKRHYAVIPVNQVGVFQYTKVLTEDLPINLYIYQERTLRDKAIGLFNFKYTKSYHYVEFGNSEYRDYEQFSGGILVRGKDFWLRNIFVN